MRHTYRNRKTIGLVSTLALALVATASLGIASSPATAQTSDQLDPAKCDSTAADGYMPANNAYGETARKQCEALVAFRNQLVRQSPGLQPGHNLLQWGTGERVKINLWKGISFNWEVPEAPDARKVDYLEFSDPDNGPLSGPIPVLDSSLFVSVEAVIMKDGLLTGEFPAWVYSLPNLRLLKLQNNHLTGSIEGSYFTTRSFTEIELHANRFSGPLPDLPLAESHENPNLVILSLGNNRFSDTIPSGYSNFANREMKILGLADNRISGNLPQWIGNLRWNSGSAQNYIPGLIQWIFNLNGNRLCFPRNLTLGAQKESNGTTDASILINLAGNVCENEEQRGTQYIPATPAVVSMEVSGQSVEVTWRADPDDSNAEYLLKGSSLYPASLQGRDGIVLSSKCARITSGTPAGEGLLSATLNADNGGANCQFDPNYMAVTVAQIFEVGSRTDGLRANVYLSNTEGRPGWNFTHVVREQTIQDIAYNTGLDTQNSISYWDGSNQRWRSYRVGQQSPNPRLAPGTPVAHPLKSRGWMDRIGVGSSGNNAFVSTGVTLYGGWNMISAGGEASGEGAFMFDDELVDCENLGGAIMILRYNSISRSYDVILPCHPTVQRSLIAGGAWGSIEDINEFDNLMIFFRSTLPVNIRWDTVEDPDNPQYRPPTLSN